MIRKAAPVLLLATVFALLSLAPVFMTGCGGSHRNDTITATFVTLTAARDGFDKWNETTQADIIAKATSEEEGKAKLAKHRESAAKVYAAIKQAFQLLYDAATKDDDKSLGAAIRGSTDATGVIRQMKDAP